MAIATGTLPAEQIGQLLTEALETDVLDVADAHGTVRVTVKPEALPRAARLCKSDPRLRFDFFDFMSGVDLGDEGFAVVTCLYSVPHRHRVLLRAVAPGGRADPRLPTLTGVYRGADWHERETYDMFGITFDGHPGLLPRILTVENFEGWPLRKDFLLATREAKPWPGAKEPEERKSEPGAGQDEAVIANAEPMSAEEKSDVAAAKAADAEAAAPQREEVEYDQALYEQLLAEGKSERIARSRAKAAAMRARKAGGAPAAPAPADAAPAAGATPEPQPDTGDTEGAAAAAARAQAGDPAPSSPEGAAQIASTELSDPSIAKDAAAGAVGGDVAAGAPGDEPGSGEPVTDLAAEARVGTGAPPVPGGTPGTEAEGRHTGAREQSGADPGATTPESRRSDVPQTPAPGSEAAPMPSDPQVDEDRGHVREGPLEQAGDTAPPPSTGTDAAQRRPRTGPDGSEPSDDQSRDS